METIQSKTRIVKFIFIALAILSCLPFVSPALALGFGIALSLIFGNPFIAHSKKYSSLLLKIAVVCLGFGINLNEAIKAGSNGFIITIFSVATVMATGYFLGKRFKLNSTASYLISAGTAICGGSAIAAIAPVIKAKDSDITISLISIFTLNAVALLIFPFLGQLFGLSQQQFGIWAAISIHDTSSVVGAGAAYGAEALKIATTIKLTRALWIIPLVFFSTAIFKGDSKKITYPWFILFFVIAMLANAFLHLPSEFSSIIAFLSKRVLTLTLFLIGGGLSREALKKVGFRPMAMAICLWAIIGIIGLIIAIYFPY